MSKHPGPGSVGEVGNAPEVAIDQSLRRPVASRQIAALTGTTSPITALAGYTPHGNDGRDVIDFPTRLLTTPFPFRLPGHSPGHLGVVPCVPFLRPIIRITPARAQRTVLHQYAASSVCVDA